jgi:hypothetical protein
MLGVHADLRAHVAASLVLGLAFGIAGAAMLVAVASGMRGQIPLWAALFFGFSGIAVGYLGAVANLRGYRRATRVVESTAPAAGTATFRLVEDSDSTSLYARLDPLDAELPLLPPRWQLADLVGRRVEVQVFRDPATSRVAALRTAKGLLWALPPSLRRRSST